MFAIEIIDLNAEMILFALKIIAGFIFKIDSNNRYTKIFLIK